MLKGNGALRIGVYVCHCGTNIAGVVDVAEVVRHAAMLPYVVVARDYNFLCSNPGQNIIKEDIKEKGLDRVVVASCSPRLHELTFRRACKDAGINPFFFQMANIREQVSWVTEDKKAATEKAHAAVEAAVRRVVFHGALETRKVPVKPAVLVVGGGITGIQASLNVANAGYQVYLVERGPSIGGHMAMFDKTFPTLDCAACILTPKMVAVAQSENIKLLTYSEVVDVSGFVGNFNVKVLKKARHVREDICTGCGVCQEKCPWKTESEFDLGMSKRKAIYTPFPQAVPNVPVIDTELCIYFKRGTCKACVKFCEVGAVDLDQKDEVLELNVGAIILATGYQTFDPRPVAQYGYKRLPNVMTSLEFERLVNSSGPTEGHIVVDGKAPRAVGIIHCVGSRDKAYHSYCSRVCCTVSLKFAHLVKERTGAEVYNFYIDMRAFGKGHEEFYHKVMEEGANMVRGKVAEVTQVAETEEEKGRLVIVVQDTLLGEKRRIPVDLVVLAVAIEARADTPAVARMFNIGYGKDGFFIEKHPKLDPVATTTDGIFIAGAAQGPKDIPDSVAQAASAAAEALSLIDRGWVTLEPNTAWVDEARCTACGICVGMCSYGAISIDKQRDVAVVNEVLCKGCGTCVAACPVSAMDQHLFTAEQLMAEIEGVLR